MGTDPRLGTGEGLGGPKEKKEMGTPRWRGRRGCQERMNVIGGQEEVEGLCESTRKIGVGQAGCSGLMECESQK